MADLLQQGVEALESGDKAQARRLLARVIKRDPRNEQAWLCLSDAMGSDVERLRCLERILEINPHNQEAVLRASKLRQKQAQRLGKPPVPFGLGESSERAAPDRVVSDSCGLANLPAEQREALEGYARLVCRDLLNGKKRKTVVEELTKRGFPRQAVEDLVSDVARVVNSRRGPAYRKRMVRGVFVALFGAVATVISVWLAVYVEGIFFVWYGAIVVGLVDFVAGLLGWLMHRA